MEAKEGLLKGSPCWQTCNSDAGHPRQRAAVPRGRARDALTSVHDPAGVHVLERTAELDKVLPDGPLRDQPLLFFEMLLKMRNRIVSTRIP